MWFVTLVLRNLWNRKVRSILTCLGMAVAICTVVSLFGIIDIYEGAATRMYRTRDVDVIVGKAGVSQMIMGRLTQTFGDRLRNLSDVASVEPMMLEMVSFTEPKLDAVYVFGWTPPPAGELMKELNFAPGAGRCLDASDRGKVMIGSGLAKSLKKAAGDTITITESPLEVVGVFDSGNLLQDSSVIMPLADLQELTQLKNLVTLFLVRVKDVPNKPERIKALCAEIESLTDAQGRRPLSAKDTARHVGEALELRVVKNLSFATSLIALVLGVIGMLNTMMISVFERTREIGTLRAVGWPGYRVVGMILQETLMLATCGAVLGLLMSLGLNWFLQVFLSDNALKIPLLPTPGVVGIALLLAFGVGILGALYPAYRAARLLPTEAVRHD